MSSALNLGLIFLSVITTAGYFTLVSKLMRSSPVISSNFFLCITNYSAALILLPVWLLFYQHGTVSIPAAEGWTNFFLASGFLLLSRELYFYAYKRTDIANITVFSSLTPLYTLLTGFILLHETPSPQVLAGVTIITLSIYSIFLPLSKKAAKDPALFIRPFKRIFTSLPILCGFLSTIPTSFGAPYQKKTLQSMDIVSFSLCLFIVIGSVALCIELIKNRQHIRDNLILLRRPSFWLAASLLVIMHVSFAPILMTHNSAVALTLQRCSILFQMIFAYYFLNQREDFRKRITAGLFIIVGFLLIWNQ